MEFLFHVLLSGSFNQSSATNDWLELSIGAVFFMIFLIFYIWLPIQSGFPCTTAPDLLLSAAARYKNKPELQTRNKTRLQTTARLTS